MPGIYPHVGFTFTDMAHPAANAVALYNKRSIVRHPGLGCLFAQ
jgi:hypothetical protein